LKQSRCIFFLDGIDELPRKPYEYEARCQKIADFVQAWPNTTFILSCRELDYNRELPFQQILIKPFDTKQIKSYMKRYFGESEYQRVFEQIKKLPSIYELCSNPFYLDIICYFSKISDQIPESKTQLFDFIVNQFIDRENQKQMLTMNKNEFMLAISHLAYYLAVQRMTTTVNIDEYTNSIKELKNHELVMKAIGYAIKGDLLEFNENSREIRFIHNRFQEFFSSFHISKNYQKAEAIYPPNFFTNIWWKETVLFVAGFNNDNTDAFINSILDHRNIIVDSNKTIENLLKLEVTILAFECIANNPFFSNLELYQKIRDSLVDEYYQGDTLVKVKVLNVLKNDKAEKATNLIHTALTDNSLWVSERAFFILTDGQLKMQG